MMMWTPIILATVVVVLVVGEEVVVVDEKVMRDQLDTLVDQEDGASRGPRVERGVMDHDEGSGGGLLGSSFPDYGIDDEDQVWDKEPRLCKMEDQGTKTYIDLK